MDLLKVAVIGCGNVSVVHLPPIASSSVAKLIAVCDIKPHLAQEVGDEYGVPWFTDYEDVFALKPDVIHICTSHHTHAKIAIEAAKRGIHVLTEKPMGINLDEADRMIRTSSENNTKLGVIFQNRYNIASQEVYNAVKNGELGKILGCRMFVTWYRAHQYYENSDWKGTWEEEGGGALIAQAIHTIDLMQWIVGEVDYLQGYIGNRYHSGIDVEDVAEASIFFKNGAIGSLYACNYYSYDADVFLEIHGEKGIARIEKEKALIKISGEPERFASQPEPEPTLGKAYWGASHEAQISRFYEAVLNDRPVEIDGLAGRKALEIVRAIYYSASHNGCKVEFPFQEPLGFNPPSLTNNDK